MFLLVNILRLEGVAGFPSADFNCEKSKSFALAMVSWSDNFAGFLSRRKEALAPLEKPFSYCWKGDWIMWFIAWALLIHVPKPDK
jgi:hypothetical protein